MSNQLLLSDLSQLPILLAADGSDTGRVWGDAQVRWASPQAGFSGGAGYDPALTTDLDLLEVTLIPEPSTLALLGLSLLALGSRSRLRKPIG